MSDTITVNRECSRCPRIEREEVSIEQVVKLAKSGLERPKALRVVIDGEEAFELATLCSTCRKVVSHYLRGVSKKLKQKSSMRETEAKEQGSR